MDDIFHPVTAYAGVFERTVHLRNNVPDSNGKTIFPVPVRKLIKLNLMRTYIDPDDEVWDTDDGILDLPIFLDENVEYLDKFIQFLYIYADPNTPWIQLKKPLESHDLSVLVGPTYANWADQFTPEEKSGIIRVAEHLDGMDCVDLLLASMTTEMIGKTPEEVAQMYELETEMTPEVRLEMIQHTLETFAQMQTIANSIRNM